MIKDFDKYNKELAKELIEIFLSGMKRENEEELDKKLKDIADKLVDNLVDEANKENKKDIKINNHRFVKFREISNKDKISDIWIDTSKIITIFDYNGEVAIRIDASEFFIYKVEGTVEEVLDKLRDRN